MVTFNIFRHESDVRAIRAGSTVFAEGSPGDSMYALLEGEVRIERQGRTIATVAPGEVFGEMALIDGKPRSASAVAVTDCRVVAVPEQRFMFLVQQTPFFALQMLRLLTERLRRNLES